MRILVAAVLAAAIGLAVGRFTVQPVARAQEGCTSATFKGVYGYVHNGSFYYQDGSWGAYAAAGKMAADGNGAVSNTETASFDGVVQRNQNYSGTYSINEDCTGTANFTDSNGKAIASFDLVLTGAGKGVQMIETDTDTMISGTAQQQ